MCKSDESPRRLHLLLLLVLTSSLCSAQSSTIEMAHANGETMMMPKGVFHYSNAETAFESKMKLPEMNPINPLAALSDLIDTAAEAGSKRQSMSGIHIPLPFGIRPLNFQLSQDVESGVGMANTMSDEEKRNTTLTETRVETESMPQMPKKERDALERARRICLGNSQKECDSALDDYHRIRFHSSPMEEEKLAKLSEPQDVGHFLSQGLAKWVVPSLGTKLREMATSRSASEEKFSEEADLTEPRPPAPKSPYFSEIRRHPTRRRARLHLPARGGESTAATSPSTSPSRRRTSKLALVPR
ncbi:hypothetical protein QR680_009534 [Steinernema hermaphroditum]|uniref:Uncharacterized protein n=1 Tax=Steinernema hermaphroditum TaxID=289476 RepID=A0AA39IKP6_9BILA|nr:hypothetical protein QR680_009534 [Steinernema hermaphroditum]